MKLIFKILFVTILNTNCNAQLYSAIIDSLNNEIKKAVSIESFTLASVIRAERNLYENLQESILNENFDKASVIKKQIDNLYKIDTAENINHSIVYLFSNKTVGKIGGEIHINENEHLRLNHGSFIAVKLDPKLNIFRTGSKQSISRILKAGKIYFIEFGSIPGYGGFGKEGTIRFVNTETFKTKTNENLPIIKGYTYEDNKHLDSARAIFIASKNNCSNCILELNGIPIIKGVSKNTTYEIKVPQDEVIITFFLENSGLEKINNQNNGHYEQYKWIVHSKSKNNDDKYFQLFGSYNSAVKISRLEKDDFEKKTARYKVEESPQL